MAIRLSASPSAVLHSNRSAAYSCMGYYGKALEDAEEAIELDPRCEEAWKVVKGRGSASNGRSGKGGRIILLGFSPNPVSPVAGTQSTMSGRRPRLLP
jgi:hypothetical protein